MNNYRVVYQYKGVPRKLVVIMKANSENEVREKFKMDIFKNIEIISIEETIG